MINFDGAFQLMRIENGMRSPAVRDKVDEFAKRLMEQCPEAEKEDYVVLVLMDDIKGEFDFSTMPYMTVKSFIELVLEYPQ